MTTTAALDLIARLTAAKLPPTSIEQQRVGYIAYLKVGTLPDAQATVANRLQKAGLRLREYGTDILGKREYVRFEQYPQFPLMGNEEHKNALLHEW